MTHPIPPGTRDILPDEMRELRALEATLLRGLRALRLRRGRDADDRVRRRARARRRARRAGRLPLLRRARRAARAALRHDDPDRPPGRRTASPTPSRPFRFSYIGSAYRAVRPQRGQMREFLQAGVELIGADAPTGTAEVIEVLGAALDAAGLDRAVIGLGDADLYRQLLDELGVDGRGRGRRSSTASPAHDLVGLEARRSSALGLGEPATRDARRAPEPARRRPRCSTAPASSAAMPVERATARARRDLRGARRSAASPTASSSTSACCATSATTPARSSRSTTRRSATSSAAAAATTSCMGRFGRPLPAAGFALYLERVHIAQAEEERIGEEGPR